METSKTYLLGVVLLCSTSIFGQGNNESFHTIREHNIHRVINQAEEIPDSSINEAPIIVDSIQVLDMDFTNLSGTAGRYPCAKQDFPRQMLVAPYGILLAGKLFL